VNWGHKKVEVAAAGLAPSGHPHGWLKDKERHLALPDGSGLMSAAEAGDKTA